MPTRRPFWGSWRSRGCASSARCVLAAALTLVSVHILNAQSGPSQGLVAGRNVNMVSGTTWPEGDPFLQRQNEPSVAASTRNPLHLLAGANDYRSVVLPGFLDDTETGDAWLGVFKSFDGGQRWQSTLLPGYPNGPASPLSGYAAGADPVVRAGASGLFFYSGLVFDREASGKSAVFVSRFIDNNNLEAGDPIAYAGSTLVASVAAGTTTFLDKPWMAVDVARSWGSTCVLTTDPPPALAGEPAEEPVTQTVPAVPVYVAYTRITRENGTVTRAEIFLTRSLDCGVTWNEPVRVSRPQDALNQGATIAINPLNGDVYVAWRRLAAPGSSDTDAFLVARSTTQGRKFSNPGVARRFPRGKKKGLSINRYFEHRTSNEPGEVAQVSQFDQGTSAADLSFRTNSYPTMTFDGEGRLYLAWAERGFGQALPDDVEGDARIVVTTSRDGAVFTPAQVIDDGGIQAPGHQIMPTLAFANGRLVLTYYDLRWDRSTVFSKYIDDRTAFLSTQPDGTLRRHTMDIRAALGTPGDVPMFAPSTPVSEYALGTPPGETGPARQLQWNPPNLPIFQLGTVPFIGDYIDVAPAPAFVLGPDGRWRYNTEAGAAPVFHGVWTDNRDVRPPVSRTATGPDWSKYTMPGATTSGPCDTGTRNQNIYTARLTQGLLAGSPGNTKPLKADLPRAFVVFAQNTTDTLKYFRMTILDQPPGGRASFLEYPLPPYTEDSEPPLTAIAVAVPRRSLVSRTVYVTSTEERAAVRIAVEEIAGLNAQTPLAGGLTASVVLNPDISNPDISNPDISNPDISNPDISNFEVHNPDISNPDISNPDISNPDISNPDISNPDISNPDISNPDISNPDISNPDISNPDISNPDISNPDISNPDISNPDISNGSVTDVTWTVTNLGNTTTAFDVNLFLADNAEVPNDVKLQLILHRVYRTPLANECELKEQTHNVLVANIPDPVVGGTDPLDPLTPTLWIEPGGQAKITLRIFDLDRDDGETLSPTDVTPTVTAQALNSEDVGDPDAERPSATPAPAPDAPKLAFDAQPVGTVAGDPLPAVVVSLKYENGTPVAGSPVALAFAENPTGAELLGTTIVATDGAGLARFDDLRLTRAGEGFRLAASAGSTDAVPVLSNPFASLPEGFEVTNTGDSGAGSLRQAILDANARPGTDTIRFAIAPGTPPFTIAPLSALPAITEAVVLDATTQPGFVGVPVVELTGSGAGPGTAGLTVAGGSGSTIRGFVVNGFAGAGIVLASGGNTVVGNYVGMDATGLTARANGAGGITVTSAGNRIGGTTAGDRNVVSGNAYHGIGLEHAGATGNIARGNYVGTNASGTAAVPNGYGIFLNGAAANEIGGRGAGAGNLVSGNTGSGIYVAYNSSGNTVSGNYVGTNATGALAIPNQTGVMIAWSAHENVIGGPESADRNLISGNTFAGVHFDGGPTVTGNVVRGNHIGTQADVNLPLPNQVGVRVRRNTPSETGASGNLIADNIIANHTGGGIVLERGSANRLIGNRIFNTGAGLAIDLWPSTSISSDGITPNDPDDADTGANGLQNYPVILSADNLSIPGQTFVEFTLSCAPGTFYSFEFFANTSCAAPTPQAERLWTITGLGCLLHPVTGLGYINGGVGSIDVLPVGSGITATARGPEGTSELSACFTLLAPTDPTGYGWTVPSGAPPAAPGVTNFLIAAAPTPGAYPTSTGLTVTVDLSGIGGGATVPLNDKGMMFGCDDIAGDGIYIGCGSAPAGALPGTYHLPLSIADAQGRSSTTSVPFTVLAPGTGTFRGTLYDNSGGILPGVTLTLSPAGGGAGVTVQTQGDGSFLAAGVPAGTWNVSVLPGYAITQFHLDGGQTLTVNLYPQSASLGATLLDGSSAPLAGISVAVTNVATGATISAITDGRGRIAVAVLPGTYDIVSAGFPLRRITVAAAQAVSLVLQP